VVAAVAAVGVLAMPRIEGLATPGPPTVVTFSAGTLPCRSDRLRMPCWSRLRWVWAVIDSGTRLTVSAWRVAVTTTSSSWPAVSVWALLAACCAEAAPA
jgi:hypothetical protein